MSSGLDSELPPQELGPDLQPGNQYPASCVAWHKEKERKKGRRKKEGSSTISKNKRENKIRKIKNILGKIKI